MAIENRDLAADTKLAANYKKQRYECEVVETPEGLRYRLAGFTPKEGGGYRRTLGETADFTTPSGAAHAVMQGMAVNGWRFWSLAEELDKPKEPRSAAPATARPPRPRKGKPTPSRTSPPPSNAPRANAPEQRAASAACCARLRRYHHLPPRVLR